MKYTHDTRANKMEEYRITIQVKKRAIHDDTRYWGETDPIFGGNRPLIRGALCDEDALYVPLSEACLSKLYPSISLKDSSWQDPLGAKRCVWNVRPVNACESPSRSSGPRCACAFWAAARGGARRRRTAGAVWGGKHVILLRVKRHAGETTSEGRPRARSAPN